jgi:RNA polymerase-associated protein RTF1
LTGLSTGKPYRIDDESERPYVVDQYIMAQYGVSTKEFPFVACSNQRFTEAEFQRYLDVCNMDSTKPCNKSFLEKKLRDINDTLHREWSNSEIHAKVKRQHKLDNLLPQFLPKQELSAQQKTQEALFQRNLMNRRKNEEQVHAALVAERVGRKKRAAERAAKQAEVEKAKAAGIGLELEKSRENTPAKEAISRIKPKAPNSLNQFTKFKNDDEMISSMDFGIDIEV